METLWSSQVAESVHNISWVDSVPEEGTGAAADDEAPAAERARQDTVAVSAGDRVILLSARHDGWLGWLTGKAPTAMAQSKFKKVGQNLDVLRNIQHFSARRKQTTVHGAAACASLSPNGARVAIGDTSGQLHIYDVMSQTLQRTLRVHDSGFVEVSFSPDGSRVAAASSANGRVCIFDASSAQLLVSAEHGESPVTGVAFSPDGEKVASCGSGGYVCVFDAATGAQLASAEHLKDFPVYGVSFSPGSERVASCGSDGFVRVFDASSGEFIREFDHGIGDVYGASFSPDGGRIATCGSNGAVNVFNASTGAFLASADYADEAVAVHDVTFSPSGALVAACYQDGHVRIFRAHTTGSGVEALHGSQRLRLRV